jgi:hypothetical protein
VSEPATQIGRGAATLRRMFDLTLQLAESYGDNLFHCAGAQADKQFTRLAVAALTGKAPAPANQTTSTDANPRLVRYRHLGSKMVDRTDGDYVRWSDVKAFFPAIGSDLLCEHCAKQFCPYVDLMHFDKDGCPSCEQPPCAEDLL